jgi:hypothetical protein
MVWSRRVRVFLVAVVAVSATVLGLPGAAPASPTAGRVASPAVAAPAVGQAPQPPRPAIATPRALGPARAGAVSGHSLDITVDLVAGGAAAQVTITPLVDLPAATLQVVTAQGRHQLHRSRVGLGALRQGTWVRRTVALVVPDGDTGLVAAVLAGQQVVGSQFVAVRRHAGQVLAAGSLAQLEDAVLAADRQRGTLSQAAYARGVAAAHRAPGKAGTVTAGAALAETTLTVSGTASYRDRAGIARPVRSGRVELVDSGGAVHISGTTRDDGSFTLSASEAFGSMTVAVRISTQSAYGVVFQPNGSYWTAYSAPQTVTSGSTWSGVAIVLARDTGETNRGFAILDQLRSLGAYYQSIRDPAWPVTRLGVSYPSGSRYSSADPDTHLIRIAGGETLCTYKTNGTEYQDWCPEDAYDWDVAAHESGHVVAHQGGFDASGGRAHNVCDNAWGTTTDEQITRDKDAAVKLAWSEGWATFYGVSALRLQPGVPSWASPTGDVAYQDRPGPPHNNPYRDINYSLESADYCATTAQASPHGEDSEMAISRALWDFWDVANDGETLSWSFGDLLGRLKAAKPTTFTAAWAALSAGRSTDELDQAGRVLETWGFAPTNLQPSGTIEGNSPARFSWGTGGSPAYPNDRFTLRVRDALTDTVLWQVTTAGTSYQPDAATWEVITRAYKVTVDVSGAQSTAPASGPFRGSDHPLTVLPNGRYVPVTPARIVRNVSVPASDGQGGNFYAFNPLGQGGVPPNGVLAVAVQLSASSTGRGQVALCPVKHWPAGGKNCNVSRNSQGYWVSGFNLNYWPNKAATNFAIASPGEGGAIWVWNDSEYPATVNVDVVGYYLAIAPAGAGSTYVPLTSTRIVNGGSVSTTTPLTVAPLGQAGIPTTNVSAVVAHVTARTTSGSNGYITVYPDGVTKPGTADINFHGTPYYSNNVQVKLGGTGRFKIATTGANATVYVDVLGYFQTSPGAAAGLSYVDVTDAEVVNTFVGAGAIYTFSPLGQAGLPTSGVFAVAFTLTGSNAASYPQVEPYYGMRVYPVGATLPPNSFFARPDGYASTFQW